MNNYEKVILKMIESGKIPTGPGQVYRIDCQHDPWCGINKGRECNCNVEVTIIKEFDHTPHTEDAYKTKKKPQYRGEKMKVFWR